MAPSTDLYHIQIRRLRFRIEPLPSISCTFLNFFMTDIDDKSVLIMKEYSNILWAWSCHASTE